jgi:hypothetical protein
MLATANALTPAKLSVDFIRAQAEQLPFPDAVFDLVLTTLSLRHWTDPRPGSPRSAECSRWMVRSSSPTSFQGIRTQSGCSMLRRRPAQIPTDLGRMLALHRLAVVGCNRTRWFRYRTSRSSPSGRRPRPAAQGQPQALVAGRAGSDDGEGDWLVHGIRGQAVGSAAATWPRHCGDRSATVAGEALIHQVTRFHRPLARLESWQGKLAGRAEQKSWLGSSVSSREEAMEALRVLLRAVGRAALALET